MGTVHVEAVAMLSMQVVPTGIRRDLNSMAQCFQTHSVFVKLAQRDA